MNVSNYLSHEVQIEPPKYPLVIVTLKLLSVPHTWNKGYRAVCITIRCPWPIKNEIRVIVAPLHRLLKAQKRHTGKPNQGHLTVINRILSVLKKRCCWIKEWMWNHLVLVKPPKSPKRGIARLGDLSWCSRSWGKPPHEGAASLESLVPPSEGLLAGGLGGQNHTHNQQRQKKMHCAETYLMSAEGSHHNLRALPDAGRVRFGVRWMTTPGFIARIN